MMKAVCVALLAILVLGACRTELDDGPAGPAGSAPGDAGYVDLPLQIAVDPVPGTKATALSGVESVGSGALVLVYRSDAGTFETAQFFPQEVLEQGSLSIRVPMTICDFYVVGNLQMVSRTDGRAVDLLSGLGDAFPGTEEELEAWVYRLDGSDVDARLRRERMSEVARFGIPYVRVAKHVNVTEASRDGTGVPGFTACRRLFAKVELNVDHSAFTGGGTNLDYFVDTKVYVRYANTKFLPFKGQDYENKAAAGDIYDGENYADYWLDIPASEGRAVMVDGTPLTQYTLYVPENMQGQNGNTRPEDKTRDNFVNGELASSIRFEARLSESFAGLGGLVSYEFMLGFNNTGDFNVRGGTLYPVNLSFLDKSFRNPYWKVGFEQSSDARTLRLYKYADRSAEFGDSDVLVIRPGRESRVYVIGTAPGSDENLLTGALGYDDTFVAVSAKDYRLGGSVFVSGSADRNWVESSGVGTWYDADAGCIVFHPFDEYSNSFYHNLDIGNTTRDLYVRMLPDGAVRKISVRLLPPIGYSTPDGSLTEGFYVGQKRSLRVSGFAGNVYFRAVQPACGDGGSVTYNAQWGTSADPGSKPGNGWQPFGGSMDVFAFYPNIFAGHPETWIANTGYIEFYSDDPFHDGYTADSPYSVPINVREPRLKVTSTSVTLPIDGDEMNVGLGYYTEDGVTRMTNGWFDSTLYATLLAPVTAYCNSGTEDQWMQCLGFNLDSGEYWLKGTVGSRNDAIENASYPQTGSHSYCHQVGTVYFVNNQIPDLYGVGNGCSVRTYVSKPFIRNGTVRGRSGYGETANGEYVVNYFGASSLGDMVMLTKDDSSFGVEFGFRYQGGNFANIHWEVTGNHRTYTAGNGQTFAPVYDFNASNQDTGSGGTGYWMYNEADQAVTASNGEPVPGGLIVPYGEQHIVGTVRNKHEYAGGVDRPVTISFDFSIKYNYPAACFFVVARTGNAKASVYMLPQKVVKYLKRMGAGLNTAQRTWMMKMCNENDSYMSGRSLVSTEPGLYRTDTQASGYFVSASSVSFPRTDYDAVYLSKLAYNDNRLATWSNTAIHLIENWNGGWRTQVEAPYPMFSSYIALPERRSWTTYEYFYDICPQTIQSTQGLIFTKPQAYTNYSY